MPAQVGHAGRRCVVRVGQQVPAAVLAPFLDGLEDERFLLRPHALQRAHATVAGGPLEFLERLYAKLAVERRDGFRADSLQA